VHSVAPVTPAMWICDVTATSVIPAATTVLSTTGTTVVMSANATGASVGGTDVICFSAFAPAMASSGSESTEDAAKDEASNNRNCNRRERMQLFRDFRAGLEGKTLGLHARFLQNLPSLRLWLGRDPAFRAP
jgi:hypothetical protein